MNFKQLDFPLYLDIEQELNRMLKDGIIEWHGTQICLTTRPGEESNTKLGVGSLAYNWDNKVDVISATGNTSIILPKNDSGTKETDFTILCTQFKGTMFEDMYNMLMTHYTVGRFRLMKTEPKCCYTWHVDSSPRFHYPIKTQEGCFMIIEDEIKHLPAHTWWETDTVKPHTALNGSVESRIHLVGAIL
jgi:hypothetical protein